MTKKVIYMSVAKETHNYYVYFQEDADGNIIDNYGSDFGKWYIRKELTGGERIKVIIETE